MSDNDFSRNDPSLIGDEKTLISEYLDHHRATLLMKVADVSDTDLRRRPTVSTMSLLGLVKHLAYVERWWFQKVFAGQEVTFPWTKEDPDADWRVEENETTEMIIELYKDEVRKARQIVAAASLEATCWRGDREFSLRWIMFHMLEEIARHNGHADFLREAIDGVTGE